MISRPAFHTTRLALAALLVLPGLPAHAQSETADDSSFPPPAEEGGQVPRDGILDFEVPAPAFWVVTIRPLAAPATPTPPSSTFPSTSENSAPAFQLASEMRYAKNETTKREQITGPGGVITENWIHDGYVYMMLGPGRVAMISTQSPPAFVTLPEFAFGDFGYINWVTEGHKVGELNHRGMTLDYYFHDSAAHSQSTPEPRGSLEGSNRTATSHELWVDRATQLPFRMVAWNHEYQFQYNLNQRADLSLPPLIAEQNKLHKEATDPNVQIR